MRKAGGDSIIKRTRIANDSAGNGKNGSGLLISPAQAGVSIPVSRHNALTTAATVS